MKFRVLFILLFLVFIASAFMVFTTPTQTETPPLEEQTHQEPVEPPSPRLPPVEQYTETQCTTFPYTTEECVYEDLLYTSDGECYLSGWNQSWMNSECKIKNTDSIGGNFIIHTGFEIASIQNPPKGKWYKNRQIGVSETAYLPPSSSQTVTLRKEVKLGWNEKFAGCYCYATSISKKKICREVERLRTECHEVVKYRVVE